SDGRQNHLFIVDDKNSNRFYLRHRETPLGLERQRECKSGPLPDFARDFDLTMMVLNDLVANGKPQSRTHTNTFGCETGIEDSTKVLFWNTNSGVADQNLRLVLISKGLDGQRTFFWHRLFRIYQ